MYLANDCVVELLDSEALGARLDLLGHFVKVMPVLVYWLLIIETIQNVTQLFVILQILLLLRYFLYVVVKDFRVKVVALARRVISIALSLGFAHALLVSTGVKVVCFRFNIY